MTWAQLELAFHFAQREEIRRLKRQAHEIQQSFIPIFEAIFGGK